MVLGVLGVQVSKWRETSDEKMAPGARGAEYAAAAASVGGVVAFGVFRALQGWGKGQTEAERALWGDSRNWTWGVFYHCPEDARAWVPKRPFRVNLLDRQADLSTGWTVNFSNTEGRLWLVALAGSVGGLCAAGARFGKK